jgi:hypothetical protein
MNNTKTLAIVAIFMAATLVVGTFAATATTQTALAYQKKRGGSQENNKNGNTVTLQACKQDATESGFDNALAQECGNTICTHPGDNASCVRESSEVAAGGGGGGGTGAACAACFKQFLTTAQITALGAAVAIALGGLPLGTVLSLDQICKLLDSGAISVSVFTRIINALPGVDINVNALIACLLRAGITLVGTSG